MTEQSRAAHAAAMEAANALSAARKAFEVAMRYGQPSDIHDATTRLVAARRRHDEALAAQALANREAAAA